MGNRASRKKSQEIRRLGSLGISKRQIAIALKVHRRTVDRHLDPEHPEGSHSPHCRVPKWSEGVDWNEVKAEYAKGVPGTVLHEELVGYF